MAPAGRVTSGARSGDGGAASDSDADEAQSSAGRAERYLLTPGGPVVADAVGHQHERWDGEGPEGMSADDIPLGARIVLSPTLSISGYVRDRKTLRSGTAGVVEKLDPEAGIRFDPAIAKLAAGLL